MIVGRLGRDTTDLTAKVEPRLGPDRTRNARLLCGAWEPVKATMTARVPVEPRRWYLGLGKAVAGGSERRPR